MRVEASLLWVGRPGDRIPVVARISTPVWTGLEAHATTLTMGTGSLSRGWSGRNYPSHL